MCHAAKISLDTDELYIDLAYRMHTLMNPYSECVFTWYVNVFLQCTWNIFIMLLAWLPSERNLYIRISLIVVGGIGWARAAGWYGQGLEHYAGRQHVYGGFLRPSGTVKLSYVVKDTKSIQILLTYYISLCILFNVFDGKCLSLIQVQCTSLNAFHILCTY